MKTQITNYTFDASARTITFGDFTTIELESIGEIINATRDAVIYNPLNKKKGGSVSGNVLTLEDNTTIMGDNDDLIVLYFVSDENPLSTTSADKDDNGNLPVVDAIMAEKTVTDTGVIYEAVAPIGSLQADAVWRVKKTTIVESGTTNTIVITWAGGGAFNQVATDLAALTYE